MRISRGALALLAVAGVGGFFLFRKPKRTEETAELPEAETGGDEVAEVDEEAGVIRLPEVPVTLPPEVTIPRVPVRSPGFVPPPISNEADDDDELDVDDEPEQPQPPIRVPPILRLPEIQPGIPDVINAPGPIVVTNPAPAPSLPAPVPRPAPAPRAPAPRPPVAAPPIVNLPEPPPQDDVPDDTAELVALMLDAESTASWKRVEPALKGWQSERGRVVDGKFGPGDAKAMAEEIGTLPIIRFWPTATGTNPQRAIDEYRAALRVVAAEVGGAHGEQLRQSAVREKGQSFGPPTGKPNAPIALGDRIELDVFGAEA